jgi:hypothetical protein
VKYSTRFRRTSSHHFLRDGIFSCILSDLIALSKLSFKKSMELKDNATGLTFNFALAPHLMPIANAVISYFIKQDKENFFLTWKSRPENRDWNGDIEAKKNELFSMYRRPGTMVVVGLADFKEVLRLELLKAETIEQQLRILKELDKLGVVELDDGLNVKEQIAERTEVLRSNEQAQQGKIE